MAQYIDKSAVIAEIERRKKYYENIQMIKSGYEDNIEDFNELLSFLDNLEVKEVDLEKEIEEVKHNYKVDNNRHTSICSADIEWLANHFFELGLKIQRVE